MTPGVLRVRAAHRRLTMEAIHRWRCPTRSVGIGKEPSVASNLTRPRDGRIIAGVCAGLARRFGWSVFVVRLLFLLSLVLPGSQVIVYLILWILMPNERTHPVAR